MLRVPYWPGKRISFGGRVDPEAVKLELPYVSSDVTVRRVVSWPGFLLVRATYTSRKVK